MLTAARARRVSRLVLGFICLFVAVVSAEHARTVTAASTTAIATYAMDFVSTAATGIAMNNSGDVTGTSYPDPGCGSFCLPTLETVVWRNGQRIVLPPVAGLSGIYVRDINAQGWVVGFAGFPGTTTHAVLWKPVGDSYEATDLGTLPGTTVSEAVGIDDQGRIVGWSTTLSFPPNGSPFMWTEAGGMVDLSALGYPDEMPLDVSPGGAVATPGTWYQLGDPSSVAVLPPPPVGFFPPGTYPTAINDSGEQARFLISTSAQNLAYLFRFHAGADWQQISFVGNGNLAPFGIGSINNAGDVTATILGSGHIAAGPDGMAQPLTPFISPAYPGTSVALGGRQNSSGQILAGITIGQSQRLVRLTPVTPCTTNCIRVSTLQLRARFVEDPQFPGQCVPGGNAFNQANVKMLLTSETGARLRGVTVTGRFLDDYWTNAPVTGVTNSRGQVSFNYQGLCGVGAIAFFVDSATKGSSTLDRNAGTLAAWQVPVR